MSGLYYLREGNFLHRTGHQGNLQRLLKVPICNSWSPQKGYWFGLEKGRWCAEDDSFPGSPEFPHPPKKVPPNPTAVRQVLEDRCQEYQNNLRMSSYTQSYLGTHEDLLLALLARSTLGSSGLLLCSVLLLLNPEQPTKLAEIQHIFRKMDGSPVSSLADSPGSWLG